MNQTVTKGGNPITRFDGGCPRLFIRQMDNLAAMNGWKDDVTGRRAFACFGPMPGDMLNSQPDDIIEDWNKLKDWLMFNFQVGRNELVIAQDVKSLQQTHGETATEFLARIRRLYSEIVKDVTESFFVCLVKLSLLPQFHAVAENAAVESLSELATAMFQVESRAMITNYQAPQTSTTSSLALPVRGLRAPKGSFSGYCNWCGHFGHKEVDCRGKQSGRKRATEEERAERKQRHLERGNPARGSSSVKSIRQESPDVTASVLLNGRPCTGLVDTGSDVTVVDSSLVESLIPNVRPRLTSASGN